MRPVTHQLVGFIDSLKLGEVPTPIVEKAKLHILDALGAALASSRLLKSRRVSRALLKLEGRGGCCTVWAYGSKSSLNVATMMNGMLIEALDYSDIHVGAGLHPTCVILPVLLTVGERFGANGKEILEAYIGGCEIMIRLGLSAPGKFHERGFQPTSLIGVLASALAVGKMMKLNRKQLTHALSLASTLTFGSSLSVRVGSYLGGIDTGRAAESGLIAALQARQNIEGIAEDVVEGKLGFLETYLGRGNHPMEMATSKLGHKWKFSDTFLKRYPTSYVHTYSIDAALSLRSKHRFTAPNIRYVRFGETRQNIALFAEPTNMKRAPRTIYDAKTSSYFLIAAALLNGRVDVTSLTDKKIKDEAVLELAGRVNCVVDEDSRWVELVLRDGRRLKSVQNTLVPSSRNTVVEKFKFNATPIIGGERARAQMAKVFALDKARNLTSLVGHLVA